MSLRLRHGTYLCPMLLHDEVNGCLEFSQCRSEFLVVIMQVRCPLFTQSVWLGLVVRAGEDVGRTAPGKVVELCKALLALRCLAECMQGQRGVYVCESRQSLHSHPPAHKWAGNYDKNGAMVAEAASEVLGHVSYGSTWEAVCAPTLMSLV